MAWASVTENERDAGRLLVALLSALEAELPGVAGPLLERLASGTEPLAVAGRLSADLDAILVDPVVLVVDDAERLIGSLDALGILEGLVRARPGRLRVAIASRRTLGIAAAKARVAGHLAELARGGPRVQPGRVRAGPPPQPRPRSLRRRCGGGDGRDARMAARGGARRAGR